MNTPTPTMSEEVEKLADQLRDIYNCFYMKDKPWQFVASHLLSREQSLRQRIAELEARNKELAGQVYATQRQHDSIAADNIKHFERVRELEGAAGEFVKKVDTLKPMIDSMTLFCANHGFMWPKGQNWADEYEKLKKLLTNPE